MHARSFKYILPLLTYLGAWFSFHSTGIVVWLPVLYAFVLIPLLELVTRPDERNMTAAEEAIAKDDLFYDWLLYMIVPLQYVALFFFLQSMQDADLALTDRAGRIMVMGLLCAIFGINVAHELGHRVHKSEQLMARALLLTSQYMHFFIEHNRGHHKHVGTPHDPSTAPKGYSLYRFWLRSMFGVYRKAWRIALKDQRKKGRSLLQNEMLRYELLQAAFCLCIGLYFGWIALGCFLLAAIMGILLLETVNYIEHYGLRRRAIAPGKYERALPEHSWNSNHIIGRLMLFELSRHSDHHYLASRKYQLLRHHDNSPQLPTGYPGSMILAFVLPLWFYVMDRKIAAQQQAEAT
jgi:alkane 1-monooxygenase